MAGKKKSKEIISFSTALEEDLSFPIIILGTKEWLDKYFTKECLETYPTRIISDPKDLNNYKKWLEKITNRFMDSETSGNHEDSKDNLDPLDPDNYMVTYQIGDGKTNTILDPYLLPELKAELQQENCNNIFHHAQYDYKWVFSKAKLPVANVKCTMVQEQLLTCGLQGLKVGLLDSVRRNYPHIIISKAIRDLFIDFNGIITKSMIYYAGRDTYLLPNLYNSQVKRLTELKMLELAQIENDTIPCTCELEMDGININTEILDIIIAYWAEREKIVNKQILDLYDEELKQTNKGEAFLLPEMKNVFSLTSPKDKLEALTKLGLEVDNVQRNTLKNLDHKIPKLLGEYSGILKNTTTYGSNILNKIKPYDNKWHPKFHQLGSGGIESFDGKDNKETGATGRFSGDAQQMPKPILRYSSVLDPTIREQLLIKANEILKDEQKTTI